MAIFLFNDFSDLVSLSFNSIKFHIFGNKAEGKYPSGDKMKHKKDCR